MVGSGPGTLPHIRLVELPPTMNHVNSDYVGVWKTKIVVLNR